MPQTEEGGVLLLSRSLLFSLSLARSFSLAPSKTKTLCHKQGYFTKRSQEGNICGLNRSEVKHA